jgi:hypothetical protein
MLSAKPQASIDAIEFANLLAACIDCVAALLNDSDQSALDERTPRHHAGLCMILRGGEMVRAFFASSALILGMFAIAFAGGDEKSVKVGDFVPGPFESFNVNGHAKGRPHCLVCKFGLKPSVIAIVRKQPGVFSNGFESSASAVVDEAMSKLEELAGSEEFIDKNLSLAVIYLTQDARDSTTNTTHQGLFARIGVGKAEEIISEARRREALAKRLGQRASGHKRVIVASHVPEPPASSKRPWWWSEKTDVTIYFYERMKINAIWELDASKITEESAEEIVTRVRNDLSPKKKADKKAI